MLNTSDKAEIIKNFTRTFGTRVAGVLMSRFLQMIEGSGESAFPKLNDLTLTVPRASNSVAI